MLNNTTIYLLYWSLDQFFVYFGAVKDIKHDDVYYVLFRTTLQMPSLWMEGTSTLLD